MQKFGLWNIIFFLIKKNLKKKIFKSSQVHLVSESRGGTLSVTDEGQRTDGRREILVFYIGFTITKYIS